MMAGKLNEEQKAQWEEFLQENPFEKEAWEGLQCLSAKELEQDLKDIKQKIALKTKQNPTSYRRAMAAAIAILLTSLAMAIYFIKFRSINPELSFESSSKIEKQMQNQETISENKEEAKPHQENNTATTSENRDKKIAQNNENFSEKQENASPKNEEKELSALQYTEAEKMIATKDKKDQELKEILTNEDKYIEEEKTVLPTQDKEDKGARKENQAAQTEKIQTLPDYEYKKDRKQKNKKSTAAAPQENRALNVEKQEGYQIKNTLLQGQIFDANTKKELKNVSISLKGHGQTIQTDSLGNFSLNVLPLVKYILVIEKPSYQTLEVEAVPNQKNIFFLKK
ncbi:MAG: hypothetical protein OHK0045_14410 [Raineya sp.]